jgi:hypothetical protein
MSEARAMMAQAPQLANLFAQGMPKLKKAGERASGIVDHNPSTSLTTETEVSCFSLMTQLWQRQTRLWVNHRPSRPPYRTVCRREYRASPRPRPHPHRHHLHHRHHLQQAVVEHLQRECLESSG